LEKKKKGILSVEEKGEFAESIVMSMFHASGLKIFQNGTEKKKADFYSHFNGRKSKGEKIKYDERLRQLLSEPDFLVENRLRNYDFVEVKLRSIGHFHDPGDDLINRIGLMKHFDVCREFWKPYIILITNAPLEDTGMFSVISVPYYERMGDKIGLFIKRITDIEEWGINPKVVEAFEDIVKQMLASQD